jgi:hypothetical protein
MSYARITRVAATWARQQVLQQLNSYLEWLVTRPGFVVGMNLVPASEEHPLLA